MPAKRTAEEVEFDQRVADRLKDLFAREGESVSSAARRADIPVGSLDNWVSNRSRLDIYAAVKIAKTFRQRVDTILGLQSPDSGPTLLELAELVPSDYHQALSDCIELLTFDEHPAAKEARELLAKQAKVLLRDAKRRIEEDNNEKGKAPKGALQPPPNVIKKLHHDSSNLPPRDPLRGDEDQSQGKTRDTDDHRPRRKKKS